MKKYTVLLLLIISTSAFSKMSAEEEEIKKSYVAICDAVKNAGWDKIAEYKFSKKYVLLELEKAKISYSNGYMSANEGLEEIIIILTGAAMRLDVDYWKKEKPNSKHSVDAKKIFCEYYNKAYLPH